MLSARAWGLAGRGQVAPVRRRAQLLAIGVVLAQALTSARAQAPVPRPVRADAPVSAPASGTSTSTATAGLAGREAVTTGPQPPRRASHRFVIERDSLTMRDGVRLAATVFSPVARHPGERFPTLVELLPYRKDDSFYLRDFPHYAWFASRGYRAVKVDVRGTGSSSGALPDREYSAIEMDDAERIIELSARRPGANGRVGMWGISWGGFNAIQAAMRAPPALRAILAVDASDDLFHDDVHYIDGIFHVDMYQLEIDHENGLPASPDYPVNDEYRRERFGATPWLIRYLRQQRNGPFWSEGSLRGQYAKMRVPCFLIGGLADGYRDSVARMLERVPAPVKAWMGPWNHDFPDGGVPGPNVEWREEALRWFDRWLRDRGDGGLGEPRLTVFVRAGHGPSLEGDAPGHFAAEAWPIPRARAWRLETERRGRLVTPGVPAGAASGTKVLHYRPGTGRAAGDWWGETPGDMRVDDAAALVFDSPPLSEPRTVIGTPQVLVDARVAAPLVHWAARLEDVAPDGAVTLVTGGARNGTGLSGDVAFDLPLHFTTWTFRAGHRVRLALTHAQFPMLWPTPWPAATLVRVGAGRTGLRLPEVPSDGRPPLQLPAPARVGERSDARELPSAGTGPERESFTDPETGETGYRMTSDTRFAIRDRTYHTAGTLEWRVEPAHPERARSIGRMTTRIDSPGRRLEHATHFTVRSDLTHFHVTVTRRLTENGRERAKKTWRESITRDGH